MKRAHLLTLSLVGNAVLLIALAVAWKERPEGPPTGTLPPSAAPSEKPDAQEPAAGPTDALANASRPQQFGWEAVESEDYREYVANLRAIGCPEQTIRDIIVADVNKLYDQKLKESQGPRQKFEYWKTGMTAMIDAMTNSDDLEQRQEFAQEKRGLLKTLLGEDYQQKPDLNALMGVNPFERILDFVSPEKQTELMELEQRFGVKLAKEIGGGVADSKDRERMLEIQREKEAEVARILTPEEKAQYDLRLSQTAQVMRVQLDGFDPTKEEFEQIFALRKAYDDEWGPFGDMGIGAEDREAKLADTQSLNAEIKEALGEDRFQEYQRAQSWEFKGLLKVAERQGLDREAAHRAYDLKEIAEQQAARLREDAGMSPAQKAEAFRGIRMETESALAGILGEEGMQTYRENPAAANWLNRIHPPPPAPEKAPAPFPTPAPE